jgi:hypothetical protein
MVRKRPRFRVFVAAIAIEYKLEMGNLHTRGKLQRTDIDGNVADTLFAKLVSSEIDGR